MTEDASAGRLYADVVADTSGFRRDLQAKLKEELKTIRAEVKVSLDTSRVATQQRALNSSLKDLRANIKVDLDTSQIAKQRTKLNNALKDLQATVKVGIEVSVTQARKELKDKIAAASQGLTAKVTLEVDARDATRTIERATRDQTVHLDLDVDTAAATAQIEGMRKRESRKPINIPVGVNTSGLAGLGGAISSLAQLPAMASGAAVLAGAVANLAGGLFAMGAAASQAVGVLAALPNLAGVAAQAMGAVTLGFSGIGEAVKALGKAQQGAGAQAAASAAQQSAAAEAVRGATERLARAQEASTERVRESQRRLALTQEAAVERVQRAQENLTQAREAAAERAVAAEQNLIDVQAAGAQALVTAQSRIATTFQARQRAVEDLADAIETATERAQDLELQLSGAALNEEGAQLALERAANQLRDITGAGSTASDLDKREADLAFRQAKQNLAEIQESNEDLAKVKADSDKRGIAGSKEVLSAQERVAEATRDEVAARRELKQVAADTNRSIKEAQYELAKTQRDNARSIFEAQRTVYVAQRDGIRDIQEAQRDLTQTQRDGARAVIDAQRDVARAMAASKTGAAGATAAASALSAALNELSPAGQRFARFVDGTLNPRFKQLKMAVQQALLPPLQAAIVKAMPLLAVIEKGLKGTATRIGAFAGNLADTISSELFKADVGSIMKSNNRALSNFGDALVYIVSALRHVAKVAGPILLEPFAKWVKKLSEGAENAAWVGRETGSMAKFFKKAKDTAKTLWSIISDVAGAIFNLGKLAAPTGDTLLDSLARGAKEFKKWTEDPAAQKRIRDFFEGTIPIMKQFGDLLARVGKIFGRFGEITGGGALDSVFWILNRILDVLEMIANLPGGAAILTTILTLSAAGLGLGLVAKGLGSIVGNIAKLAKYTGVTKLLKALGNTKVSKSLGAGVKGGLAKVGGAIKTGVSKAGGAVADVAGAAAGAVGRGVKKAAGAAGRGTKAAASVVGRGAKTAAGVVGRGASAAAAAGGQLAAAGIQKTAAAATKAAKAVGAYTLQLAKAGAGALASGLGKAASAIGGVVAAAGRGVISLGALALANTRAGLAAAGNAAKIALVTIGQKLASAATVIWTGVTKLLNLAMTNNPIGWVIKILGLLVAAFVLAYTKSDTFRKIVDGAWQGIQTAVKVAWAVIQVALHAFANFITNTLAPKISWFYNNIIKPVWSLITGAVKVAVGLITGNFDLVRKGLDQVGKAWSTVWHGVATLLSSVWNSGIKPLFTSLANFVTKTIPDAFKLGSTAVGTFWKKLGDLAKAPIKFLVNTVYNDGIRALWNWISGKVGGGLGLLPEIKGFATGGIYPGYTPGRDVGLAAVSGGEAIMRPEWTRAMGPAYVDMMNRLARNGGVKAVQRAMMGGFANGGVVGGLPGVPFAGNFDIGGIVGSFINAGKKFFANGLKNALNMFMNPVISLTDNTVGKLGGFGQLVAQVPRQFRDNLVDFVMRFAGVLEGGDSKGVVEAAKKYLGQGDDRGMDNNNRFTRHFGWPAGTPWCALFASTAIEDAHAQKAYPGSPTAAVWTFNQRMKHIGIGEGRAGDLATYGSDDHVNIITGARSGGMYPTIGGNQGPVVNAYRRGGQATVLRPAFARGGIVPNAMAKVFGQRNLDPADRSNPLVRLMNGLSPAIAGKVGAALAQVPALNRDSGGPLYPGRQVVHNNTGAMEWVLTPEAVQLLGGPRAVQSLNVAAQTHRTARSSTSPHRPSAAAGKVGSVTQNIYPQPRQSEHEIAMGAARKLGRWLR